MASFSASRSAVNLAIDPLITCRLCLTEFPRDDTYQLEDCGCIYCRELLDTVNNSCRQKDSTSSRGQNVKSLVDDRHFSRYRKLRFQKEVDLDPHRTFCPEAGCETVCHVCSTSSSHAFSRPTPVDCPKCKLQFCSVCKSKWHHRKTCDEVIMSGRKEDQGIPFSSVEDSNIKRCPVCHVPIERNDGCAQMMCKRCKHVFCWYCLTSLDDDFLLRHYDKGPCKNKLGHSRASVIWHRTQVIGIFAGFGVLLLVASPFLLLAAPCILCCKCKVCKCCDDEEGEPPST
ncbi:R144A-like protein [Mya arenaria]|uniref:RBR-type E3 ubiquitin transferase n=1 Tax=Mya arenaria TaxID=6604 RepID=A0ABY7FRU8_MYAAR|nr:R144A-like protein [Mya arenaria]